MKSSNGSANESSSRDAGPQPRFTGLDGLAPGDAMDSARMMATLLTLAGEVFVLKAEVQRLRIALGERQLLDDAALQHAAGGTEMGRWMAHEQDAFGRSLLHAFTHPDEAPDVSGLMERR